MIRYFHWAQEHPFLKTLGEIYYYATIVAVMVVFMILVGKRLVALDYPERRVRLFVLLAIVVFLPAGYFGSRAATMFYKPFDQWSVGFFFENIFCGTSHTYHASLILPVLIGTLLCHLMRLKFLETFDAIFLYMPFAHAFGRLGCLIAGCCWGRVCRVNLYGLKMHFQNPVPLYAIITNICLFLFLRRLYGLVYADQQTRERYRGVILASYFMIYPAIRIIYEVFRSEHRIFFGLTQAQYAMGIYLLFSMAIFLFIWYRYRRGAFLSVPYSEDARETIERGKRLFSVALFLVSYMLFIFAVYHLTRNVRIWQWPFQPVVSLPEAYMRILYYLPMMIVPIFSLYWLKRSDVPIRPCFKWDRFSWAFLLGLAVSIYYAVDLLVFRRPPRMRGLEFWPPIIVLSLLNAVSEEVMYRLALYRLIRRAEYPRWVAYVVQSLIYSLIHYMIAGAVLGTFSLVYGLVLQFVTNRNRSILPAIICHFIIDIGCIGVPILRIR